MTATAAQPTTGTRPRHTWVPYAGAAAGAVLVLKAVLVMATDDGAPTISAVLYLLGLAVGAGAAVGAGLRRDRTWARVAVALGAVVLLVLWIMGLGDALKPVIGVVTDSEIVKAEVPIALAGAVLLALSWWGFTRDTRSSASA